MDNKTKKANGTTLLELIVAMALSIIVTGAVYAMYTNSLHISSRMSGEVMVMQKMRVVLGKMDLDIGQTDLNKSIVITFDDPDFQYTDDQKILTAIGFPRAYGKDDKIFQTDEKTGQPDWKTFRIIYRMRDDDRLRIKDVPISQIHYTVDSDNPYIWHIDKERFKSFCDGRGDTASIADDVACFNVQKKLVPIQNDKKRSVGDLELYLNLFYINKKGLKSYYKIHRTFYARNSCYVIPGPRHEDFPVRIPPTQAPRNPVDNQ